MKLINTKIQILSVITSLTLLLLGAGCASTSGGSESSGGSSSGGSRSLKQVDLEVEPKMNRYHNVVGSGGGVTEGEKQEVNSAYARYQTAYNQALKAAGNNPNAPAPANVTSAATDLIGVLDSVQ
jgi:hypothetical protein